GGEKRKTEKRETKAAINRRTQNEEHRHVVAGTWASGLLLPGVLEEALAQLPRDRSGLAAADDAIIDLHDRDHLRRGAGEEAFVRGVDVVARQGHFLRGDPGGAGQLQDRAARDPFEDLRVDRGGAQDTGVDEEDGVARAFGDLALVVEYDRFEAAGPDRLDLGENVVEVVERLDARVDRVVVVANGRGRDDLHPLLVQLRGVH